MSQQDLKVMNDTWFNEIKIKDTNETKRIYPPENVRADLAEYDMMMVDDDLSSTQEIDDVIIQSLNNY